MKDCSYGKYMYSCLEFIPIKHLSELSKYVSNKNIFMSVTKAHQANMNLRGHCFLRSHSIKVTELLPFRRVFFKTTNNSLWGSNFLQSQTDFEISLVPLQVQSPWLLSFPLLYKLVTGLVTSPENSLDALFWISSSSSHFSIDSVFRTSIVIIKVIHLFLDLVFVAVQFNRLNAIIQNSKLCI